MKRKIWLFQLPIVALFTFAFWVSEAGVQGNLQNAFLRERAFPTLQMLSGWFTNMKFHARGETQPRNKVVVVAIDDDSIAELGRWPWHRDLTARLIEKVFDAGAKVVGLDIVMSERDQRVSDDLANLLRQKGMGETIPLFETDYVLQQTIARHAGQLVLGWTADNYCQPAYGAKTECAGVLTNPAAIAQYPTDIEKFAYQQFQVEAGFSQASTPLLSVLSFLANVPMYNAVAQHAGYFNAWPDSDGYVRQTNLLMTANGRAYPSLPLEMARVAMNEDLRVVMNRHQRIDSISFAKSGREIPVSPLGVAQINFRGKSNTFTTINANQLLTDGQEIMMLDPRTRTPASANRNEILKDSYALIGPTALGVFDMRAFPFDSNSPGVEGHATILDNLLSNDLLRPTQSKGGHWILFLLMTAGALLFAYFTERFESIPALLLFLFVYSGLAAVDTKVLFAHNINWNTSLVYVEIGTIFMFVFAVKYVIEERNKKFIRGAFAKYVAPAIVDSIIKDPTKLSVGGEKKELTILFSDIRSFTTMSEKMDARALAKFLNDYLGIMTDIVFDNGGTLDKYIGDAVMAFWGAPLDQPKHAANAVKAARKMMETLAVHRPRFLSQYGVEVNIGIGINSGAVNVGNMGSERIFEYTVIGDHVNLASRMEGLTKPYAANIVTSRFSFDMIKASGEPYPEHRILDSVKVKGKKNAVELIQVLDRAYDPKGLELFAEGREFYKNQKWDEAIKTFAAANELTRLSPDKPDGTCLMYVDRCKEFKLNPPAADWDGSWEMHSK